MGQIKARWDSKKKLNIDRILKLGWSPTIDLDTGISRTVSEFRKKENIRGI